MFTTQRITLLTKACLQKRNLLSSSLLSRIRTTPNVVETNPVYTNFGRRTHSIVEGNKGTYKPSPFQQKILVWTKTYPSIDKIPDRITRVQMKNSMDKCRVKVCLYMMAFTFISAAVVAYYGRKARLAGMSVSQEVIDRHEKYRRENQEGKTNVS